MDNFTWNATIAYSEDPPEAIVFSFGVKTLASSLPTSMHQAQGSGNKKTQMSMVPFI